MNRDPQLRRARRTPWLEPAAFVLMAGVWGMGAARADIYVHVMNCSEDAVDVFAFDAKDSVKVSPASSTTLPADKLGESQQLHCAGEGEGFCQMTIDKPDCEALGTSGANFHLDSGKWAVVTSVGASGESCTVEVEKNLDSAPSSCD